jgi:hypothetical protein
MATGTTPVTARVSRKQSMKNSASLVEKKIVVEVEDGEDDCDDDDGDVQKEIRPRPVLYKGEKVKTVLSYAKWKSMLAKVILVDPYLYCEFDHALYGVECSRCGKKCSKWWTGSRKVAGPAGDDRPYMQET